jgi:integrase
MGRNKDPLYFDKKWKIFYARWYEGTERHRLSLGTGDRIEANRRLPVVQSTKMSWTDYQKSIAGMNTMVVNSLDAHKITPPLSVHASPENISTLVGDALKTGNAFFDATRGYWIISSFGQGLATDSTAMPNMLGLPEAGNQLLAGIGHLQKTLSEKNNAPEIDNFYRTTMLQLYLDKKTAGRFAEIWLGFLKEKAITSWNRITEQVCLDFKVWRKSTPISKNGRPGKPPSNRVINRHIQFLDKSFDEAVACDYMKLNPIRNWRRDPHIAPPQKGLTVKELIKLIQHPKLQKNYLMNGLKQEHLGYRLADVILLLFTACKRRKEILSLKIEAIDFKNHWVHYTEFKNSSKGTSYSIHKAFWITPTMEKLLKRVIAGRTSGYLFPGPSAMRKGQADDGMLNHDYVSAIFKEVIDDIAPGKDATLHNLRHTATDIMEHAGLTDQEQDYALGHYDVKTALRHYQDKSADAIARRLSGLTRKGIEILSKTVEDLL